MKSIILLFVTLSIALATAEFLQTYGPPASPAAGKKPAAAAKGQAVLAGEDEFQKIAKDASLKGEVICLSKDGKRKLIAKSQKSLDALKKKLGAAKGLKDVKVGLCAQHVAQIAVNHLDKKSKGKALTLDQLKKARKFISAASKGVLEDKEGSKKLDALFKEAKGKAGVTPKLQKDILAVLKGRAGKLASLASKDAAKCWALGKNLISNKTCSLRKAN